MSVLVLGPPFKPSRHNRRLDPRWADLRSHCPGAWMLWERGSREVEELSSRRRAPITFGAGGEWRDHELGPGLHLGGAGYVDTGLVRLGVTGSAPPRLFAGVDRWTVVVRCRVAVDATGTLVARAGGSAVLRTFELGYAAGAGPTPFVRIRGANTDTSWGLDDNAFHNIYVTWDGATCLAYFDEAQGATAISNAVGAAEETAETLMFGARTTAAPAAFLTGDIEFVAVVDYALSPAEIARWNSDLYAPWRPQRRWAGRPFKGVSGRVWLEQRASGSGILTLGAIGKPAPLPLRASGVTTSPIQAAASARFEPRASGIIPLILQAAGKVFLDPGSSGAVVLPIVALGRAWFRDFIHSGLSTLGPLVFQIRQALTRRRVLRLEIWTDFQYGGGQCVGVLRSWHRGTLRHHKALNAESHWTVTIPGVPAFVETDRVLRIVYSDATRLERLITEATQQVALSGELVTMITAEHPILELGLRGQIRSVDAAGRARTRFERSSLTGKELLTQFIVGTMHELGFTYWQAGTVERDRLVRLTFDGSNPLDRLIALRDELGLEIVVWDDGVGSLTIDLVAATASERPTVPARWGRNTGPASVQRRLMDQATKIYVRGMREVNDEPASMGTARWRVRAAVSTDYDVWLQDAGELGFGPLRLPGQLVGKLLTWRGAGHVERRVAIIADDVAAQSVRLEPVAAAPVFAELGADALVGLLDADGTELTSVEVPGAEPLIMTLDRPEVPSTNNPLRNAAMRHWILDAAGQPLRPVGWRVTSDAGASLAKNTFPSFWETGGASALLNTKLENEGLRGDVTELEAGTEAIPFLSAFARFWPTVGQLYLLLELFDEVGDAYAWPIGLDDPWTVVNPERGIWQTVKLEVDLDEAAAWWNERHPLDPIVQSFWAARVSLLQKGPILAEAYVDRLQVTPTRAIVEFAEGSGPAQLWHAGNEALADYMGEAESVTVDFKDLSTLGGGEIPPTAVDPGVRMAVRIPLLNLTRNTRVLAMDLDEDDPPNSSVTLAGRTDELTERLNRTQRFTRTKLNA